MTDEPLRVFDRRERRYPLPTNGTPEEAVKACLKAWRNPERYRLSTGGDDATSGRVLPLKLAYLLDVRRLVSRLPEPHQTIVILYFTILRPPHANWRTNCEVCQEHYGNAQIARALNLWDSHGRPDARAVGQYKRAAISRIAATLHPEFYRGKKARAGV